MYKSVSFFDNRQKIGAMLNDFFGEMHRKHRGSFELIDVKYSMGEKQIGEYSYVSAIVIYKINE